MLMYVKEVYVLRVTRIELYHWHLSGNHMLWMESRFYFSVPAHSYLAIQAVFQASPQQLLIVSFLDILLQLIYFC
jgi:hypothetical protein